MKSFTLRSFYPLLLSAIVLLSSCDVMKSAMKRGDYDSAIQAAKNKIQKGRLKDKHVLMLEDAWGITMKRDLDYINQLKIDGSPEAWVQIADVYAEIDYRQDLISPYLPLFIKSEFRNAEINLIDVNTELAEAKKKAAEYLYETAMQKLAKNDKLSARNAYYDLLKIKNDYFDNFRDVNDQLNRAYAMGTNHILLQVVNTSGMIIPVEFESELRKVDLYSLQQDWLEYDVKMDTATDYDYYVITHVTRIDIGPDFVKERNYKTESDVKDGWKYLTDDQGKYVLDSLGNKIKVDNIIHVVAEVLETSQQKTTVVAGSVDFHDANSEQLIRSIPFEQIMKFDNIWMLVAGDKRALTDQQSQLLNNKPVPFPTSNQMILDAATKIRYDMSGVINSNSDIILQ